MMDKKIKTGQKLVAILVVATMAFQLMTVNAVGVNDKNKDTGIPDKPQYDVSEIIVKYKKGADRDSVKSALFWKTLNLGVETQKPMLDSSAEVIDVGSADKMQQSLDVLQKNSNVEYAEPNYKLKTFSHTDEPMYTQEWGLENSGQTVNDTTGTAGVDIDVKPAWDLVSGSNTLIGLLDTGVDINHTDLSSNVFTNSKETAGNGKDDDGNNYVDDIHGYDFLNHDATVFDNSKDDKHGTNVAGVIAAASNGSGTVGVAPNAKILPLKFMSGTSGDTADAINAIEYAKEMGVQIMNVSWGCPEYNNALKDEMSGADMLFVCAAGNGGDGSVAYPAAFNLPNIISVGSIDSQGNVSKFNSTGNAPDLYAPGENIVTTDPNNAYATVSGTSFAAAYVSGIAALVKDAVPSITTSELKLALINGYSEKGAAKIKVADANNAIKTALPLKYLNDTKGRLSQAMAYAQKIMTPEIADLLTRYTSWGQMDDAGKNTLTSFFSVSADDMGSYASSNLNLTDSIVTLLAAEKVNLSAGTVVALLNSYKDGATFDSEINNLSELFDRMTLSDSEKSTVVGLMEKGYKVSEISNVLIVAKTIDGSVESLINPQGGTYDFSNTGYTGNEKDCFLQFVQKYGLNETAILNYLKSNAQKPSAFQNRIVAWQKTNNFYIVNNKVTAYAVDAAVSSGFNKYKLTKGNAWSSGNASIDKTDGTLTYTQPLLSLSGRNGLNLNLGLRFDSDVSDAVLNANDSSLLAYTFRITETRQYYSYSSGSWVRDTASDVTNTYTTKNESDLAAWEAKDGQTVVVTANSQDYVESIRITAGVDTDVSSLNASGLSNYNNSRYGLGIGWALDLPSVEMAGNQMYLHLPGGAKYRLLQNGSNYTIDGYKLGDVTFGTATGAAFTVNSVAAAYVMTSKDGSKVYFAADGRYLGVQDVLGNKIQVYYNADGTFDRIYDTAGRYVKFAYSMADSTKTVTVQLVDNAASNPTTQTLYTVTETLDSTTNTYELTQIADAASRTTQFGYGNDDSSVIFNYRSAIASATEIKNKAIYLSMVTAPTGAQTVYDYTTAWKQYGYASDRAYKRVADTYLLQSAGSTDKYGYTSFHYSTVTNGVVADTDNTYWMYTTNQIYPMASGVTGQATETVGQYDTASNNQMQVFSYDGNGLTLTTTVSDGSGANKTVDQVVLRDSFDQPTDVQEKTLSADGSSYTLKETTYTWDQYGNLLTSKTKSGDNTRLKSVDSQSGASYDYAQSKSIPTTTLQYLQQTSDSKLYATQTTNTIDSAKQQITSTKKSIYDMTASPGTSVKDMSSEQLTYDTMGNVTEDKVTDLTDNAAVDAVVGSGNVNKVVDTTYVYDGQYQIYSTSQAAHNVKDADGNALKKADGTTTTDVTTSTQYTTPAYTLLGLPTSTTDANGYVTSFTYDSLGNVLTAKNPNNSIMTNTYDYANRTVTTTDVDGTAGKVVYDVFGNAVKSYRLNKNRTSYDLQAEKTYDILLRVKAEKDYLAVDGSNYNLTTYTYDAFGRASDTKTTKPDGSLVSEQKQSYAQATTVNGVTGAYNATTVHTLTDASNPDKGYQAVGYTDALGRTAYTQNYNAGSYFTDSAVYSNFSNLTRVSGDTTNTQSYTADLTKNQQTTNAGNVLTSDGQISDPIEYIKNYNGFGQQAVSTDANGNSTIIRYDALGRAVETYTPFQKDDAGNIIYTKAKTYYDAAGRTVETKQQNNKIGDAESYSDTKNTYDNMENLTAVERVNGTQGSQFTQYVYDNKGRVLRVYTGLTALLTINGLDNVVANGDPVYEVTKYAYDFYGNIVTYTDGNGNSEAYKYNEMTNQLTEKDLRNGDKITYTYDNAGNTTGVTGNQSGATLTNTYTYDLGGNLLESKNNACDTTYVYDDMGRMTKETDVYTGGSTFVKEYTYDGKYVLTYKLTKDGTVQVNEGYEYESNGRLHQIDYGNFYSQGFYYDQNGNITCRYVVDSNNDAGTGFPNHEDSDNYIYNLANLLVDMFNMSFGPNFTSIYGDRRLSTYQLDGNLLSQQGEDDSTSYSYDGLGRLISEDRSGSASFVSTYSYDDYSNRASQTYTDRSDSSKSAQTAYTYDKANRLQTEAVTSNGTTANYQYSYDDAGNLLQKQKQASGSTWTTEESIAYDALNETSSVVKGSTTTSFKYDANGQRISKTSGNTTTQSVWNGGSIAADYATTGGTTTYNQYLSANMGVIVNGSAVYANTLDVQGNANHTMNMTAGTVSDYSFDAYGNQTSGEKIIAPFNYRNQYLDSETGLYYLNARYYDPTTGTFTQEDTFWGDIKSPATLNLYGYCNGNPVLACDPTGHRSQGELLRNGSRGGDVSALQSQLNANGASLDVDGQFGPLTRSAVKAYQASHGLAVDGIVGDQTWSSLFGTSGSSSSSSSGSGYPGSYVQEGQSGSSVAAVQQQLNANGASLAVDGQFGPQTLAAVESFQSNHGLSVDGVVGPNTWGVLFGSTSSSHASLSLGSTFGSMNNLLGDLSVFQKAKGISGIYEGNSINAGVMAGYDNFDLLLTHQGAFEYNGIYKNNQGTLYQIGWYAGEVSHLFLLVGEYAGFAGLFSRFTISASAFTDDPIYNDIIGKARIKSALKTDYYHNFPSVIDNYAGFATKSNISNGALYQLEGSYNGVLGRFEWIIQDGSVTHRMFVPGGTLNGVPIKP